MIDYSVRRADHSQDLYDHVGICDKRCLKCVHGERFSATLYDCRYILDEGKRRPCPAGKECTEFQPSHGERVKKHFVIKSTCIKICEACKNQYLGGQKQRFCPECMRKKQNQMNADAHRRKRLSAAEAEYAKVKHCRLCGNEFHHSKSTAVYCEDCKKIGRTTRKRWVKNKRAE